jgi:metal-responsive CopG/Arc/MetJ family transcriptional regulator
MATKTRVNVTFDPETLRLADREARRHKTSRSSFIRTAIRAVASEHEQQQADAALLERQRKAVATMDRFAQKAGDWPAVEILHAWRYRLHGGKK